MKPSERMEKIRKIIKREKISSQISLQNLLAEEGIQVTQSTLSRDLRKINVGKLHDVYYFLEEKKEKRRIGLLEDFRRGFLTMSFSGNLGVLHTLTGHADTMAIALDNLAVQGILGTIAGDDTLLIIMQEDMNKQTMQAQLEALLEEGTDTL